MSCDNVLCRYFASQFLRGLPRIPRDGEPFLYEAVIPSACDTTFGVGSSIGSQRPGVARAIVRHVHSDPYELERRTIEAIEKLRNSNIEVAYTTIVGMEIDVLGKSLIAYSDAEQYVADALVRGAVYGIHYAEEAQSALADTIERHSTLEPEMRKAGLKLSGHSFKDVDEWNRWTLNLVKFWERTHGVLLAIREVEAVMQERSTLLDPHELSEPVEHARTSFTDIASRSARFRAAITALGDEVHRETWMAVGRSCAVGFCVGAGWLHADVAVEYMRHLAKWVKQSIRSAKSQKFGLVLGKLTIPLPSDDTVAKAYLLAMWEGAEFGAQIHNHPALAAEATRQRQLLLL